MFDSKKNKTKKRYFFLFNDVMLVTKKESKKRFWLRIHITLRSDYVSVEDAGSMYSIGFVVFC